MIYKVLYSDSSKLLSLPESGMGYQIIEANSYGSNYVKKYVAYNSELIIEYDENFLSNKRQIIQKGFSTILNEAVTLNFKTETIKLASKSIVKGTAILSEEKKNLTNRQTGGKGATDNQVEIADGKEIFVRLSAYDNDMRIDYENKRLKEGAFSTTLKDYVVCCIKKDDPIDRYALPNNQKIKWAYFIRPNNTDTLQIGIVQPAFEHTGGGIEAYFAKGTSKNTFFKRGEYDE